MIDYNHNCKLQAVEDITSKIAHSVFATQINSGTAITQPQKKNLAKSYVNGDKYMEELSEHMLSLTAGSFLYISDWAMDLAIHLKRKGSLIEDDRLVNLLATVAKNDVQIRVLLWDEPPFPGLNTKDVETEAVLESILGNNSQFANHIRVIRHRPSMTSTHHQKFVVSGNSRSKKLVAFLGGLDLTWGRWDNAQHPLVDQKSELFIGDDYYNPCIYNVDSNDIDRNKHPRMPWHDVHMKIEGPAARDVERNFVQRWNSHLKSFNYTYASDFQNTLKYLPIHVPKLRKKQGENGEDHEERVFAYTKYRKEDPYVEYDDEEFHERDTTGLYELKEAKLNVSSFEVNTNGKQTVQIIRTMNENAGLKDDKKETSIHEAFIKAIKGSQHYIFIESQYLIGSFSQNANNLIFEAITERIIKAHKDGDVFRVYIIFPVQPDSSLDDASMREFMFWQWQTIHRKQGMAFTNAEDEEDVAMWELDQISGHFGGMFGRLKQVMPFKDIDKYLNIFNLRNYGEIKGRNGEKDKLVTEQIYVHAKMMIVDDRIAIIGTANLNDRSLLGDMDSEMAAVIIDHETEISVMNGKKCHVRKFARDLRIKLWSEHLGLISDEERAKILDPISDNAHDTILNRAKENTINFETIFPGIPSNKYSTIKAQIKALNSDMKNNNSIIQAKKIKGYLVQFPLLWLWKETGISNSWRPNSFYS